MNGPFESSAPQTIIASSMEFDALCPPPQLLPGESLEHYRALQAVIFRDLAPKSAIEWLLAIDIAEISWEIQRYRMLRHRLLQVYRQKAIEASLRRIDIAGFVSDSKDVAEIQIVKNATDWLMNPSAADDIEARLESYGFDQHALNTEVYVQAREFLSQFETLLSSAQLRRLLMLKEISGLRRPKRSDLTHSHSPRR